MLDIQKSFTFQTDDERWTNKVLLGALISAVPILNFAATGYGLEVVKNVIEDDSRPLPTWDDLGHMFVRGLVFAIGIFIYFLPLLIVGCLFGVVGGGLSNAFNDSQSGSNAVSALVGGVGLLFGCIALLYSLAVLIVLPAAMVRFSLHNQLGQMFRFSELFADIRANTNGYLTTLVVMLVAAIVLGLVLGIVNAVLFIIPVCGWILGWIISAAATFYLQLAYSHLWGQFYRDARADGTFTV